MTKETFEKAQQLVESINDLEDQIEKFENLKKEAAKKEETLNISIGDCEIQLWTDNNVCSLAASIVGAATKRLKSLKQQFAKL